MSERNQETPSIVLSKLKGMEFIGPRELAEFLTKEDVRFPVSELTVWCHILAKRFDRSGTLSVPDWLVEAFVALTKGLSTKAICDPWAGIGCLIGALREACRPNEAFAFSRIQGEQALGRVLVPEANWQVGDPLHLLSGLNKEWDLVASILPMGARSAHPLEVRASCGETIELRDDFGNLLMVAACMRLSSAGIGLFVVTPSFFTSQRSVFQRLGELDLGIEAALALPSGTFAPYTNIPAYLVVVRRKVAVRMFVAQLSTDIKTNEQIVSNFRQEREGGSLELGRFVDADSFKSIEALRTADRIRSAERRFGSPAVRIDEVATAINLGRPGDDFAFQPLENSLFVPLIGSSDVIESFGDLRLKKQNYAQVVIDSARSNARFVSRFLNSEFGKELREQSKSGSYIPKLNKQSLKELRVFVPDLLTQQKMLEIEASITTEHNTVMALRNELAELRRELWTNPNTAPKVEKQLSGLAKRLALGVKQHTDERLDQWFETLPFPQASILRAWQATQSQDYKTKYEHLLHFFEGTAEFFGVILLSAFSSNEGVFESHKRKLAAAMQQQGLNFQKATFGTWKLVVEYLGKQTRDLLSEGAKKPDDAKNDRALCAELFSDPSLSLPHALSRTSIAAILSTTNKMRNDWGGHGGVVGQEVAQGRNEQLLGEVQKLREATADSWAETQLIHAMHCLPRGGVFENEVAILMGSNSEFLKERRAMATWLDVERLYLSKAESGRALKLLPLVQVGPSPQSAKNACYFFSRLERDGARFVSYHFAEKPELTDRFADAVDTIRFLNDSRAP